MESINRKPGRLGTAKSSHMISKLNSVSSGTTSSTRIIPTIRIVQIFAPQVFETDAANFRALVQKLTGYKTEPKKLNRTVCTKKSDSVQFKKPIVQTQSAESHSHASTVIDELFSPNQVVENEYHVMAPLAGTERDSLEEDGVQVCDNFSELFGGLEELNLFGSLRDSGSLLPEFPMIYPATMEQIDYHSSFFKGVNPSGFSLFNQ
ncbi:hypothetical protein SUGI_0422270 [Cryptomeria japonica]|uniref:uncharacterized protein LOC131078721 n=1 Tax=Cryptomeria japonica TaxID=3369 RepID=UPI002408CE4B|nr:uncharacterized protein LOC131078721 [Cryptomeria japonica]GLJ22430.1 hypothetical protein SUGI_0422270 [Cryptomeria japonica]